MSLIGQAIIDEYGELLSIERVDRCVRVSRPPAKTALRETLEAKPEALAVVDEEFEGGPAAIAEDEQGAGEGIGIEMGFAKLGQRVNAFSEIDRLVSEKDFEMRDELNHLSQKRRKSARREVSRSGVSCGRRRVRRVPSGRSSRRRQEGVDCVEGEEDWGKEAGPR